jgi:hypothetical protein
VGLGISAMLKLSDESRVFIKDGLKREVLDDASLTAEGIGATAPSPLALKDFEYLPWGDPIALDGSLFAHKDTKRDAVLLDGQLYDIDAQTRKEIDFTKLFRASTGTLSAKGLSVIPEAKPLTSLVIDENSQPWLLSKSGKTELDSTDNWVKNASEVSNALVDKFPTTDFVITGSNFIRADTQKTIYLLKDGVIRATYNDADRAILSEGTSTTDVIPVSESALGFIPKSVLVLPAGLVVVNSKTRVRGIIDSNKGMITFGETSMALRLDAPRSLTTLQLLGYPSIGTFGLYKLSCPGQMYVVANAVAHKTSKETARELPGVSTKLSATSCAQLTIADQNFGLYIGHESTDPVSKKVTKKAYKIAKGKRLPFKNLAEYKLDNLTGIPLTWVDDAFIKNLPLGAPMIVSKTSDSSSDEVNQAKTYKVVAGDTLSMIATRFKTTVATLLTLNNLTNSNQLRIGQVLKLPSA